MREAALIRLRPVLMTSAATICGHFPLTLVSGAGAAARNSIGITIVAGMALGTLFTLLVIPSIYVLIAKQHVGEEGGAAGPGPRSGRSRAGGPSARRRSRREMTANRAPCDFFKTGLAFPRDSRSLSQPVWKRA